MGWFKKLTSGLSKSSSKITESISGILTKRKLDEAMLEELEDALIMADLGASTAATLVQSFGKTRFNKEVTDEEVRQALAVDIAEILTPVAVPLQLDSSHTPQVILMVGVNGNGKTTTLGKLAKQYHDEGKKVMIAACDTFRAAAVEQLQVWGERAGCPVVTGPMQSDPASVAYQALERAKQENADVLLIDTAGRLQNKKGLMEELAKIIRVLQKLDETAPHHTLLVLDATTGQNAHSQVKEFQDIAAISGLVVTKLDGSAKGGVVVALAEAFGLPIHAVGVGEAIDDLHAFDAHDFARGLMGVSANN